MNVNQSLIIIALGLSLIHTSASSAENFESEGEQKSANANDLLIRTANQTLTSMRLDSGEVTGQSINQPPAPTGGIDLMNTLARRPPSTYHVGLNLAGGGARGAAHIGVLKVLEQEGIRPDFIAGTSMGAIVGSLYCAGVPVAEIERLMLSGEMKKGLLPSSLKWQSVKYVPSYILKRIFQLKPLIGLYSGNSLAKFIDNHVPSASKNIEDLKIPFAAIGTNLLDTRSHWITTGDVGTAVQASSTMPFVYRPVKLDGRLVVDGGLRSTLHDIAKASGARTMIAVKLQSTLDSKSDKPLRTIIGLAERVITIVLAEIESRSVAGADVLIEPDVKSGTMDSFEHEDIVRSIEAGEAAARKMLPQIRAQLAAIEATAGLEQGWH